MLSVGDYAYDLIRNENVQIIEKDEIWGFTTYKVYNPFSREVYKLSSEQIGEDDRLYYDENYVRYMAILGKVKEITSQGILSSFSKDIIPLPHQLQLKEDYEKKQEEDFRKYSYALELRIDAAKRIGIENIRKSRLKELEREKEGIKLKFKKTREFVQLSSQF